MNPAGLHGRAGSEFVITAAGFESKISVTKGGLTVNGKSIMGMLMLAAELGSRLVLVAEGTDAKEAVASLAGLITSGFGEI